MKKILSIYILFLAVLTSAQTNYSDFWEDFYSYNNVKDFVKVDDVVYALSDNAVFTYNEATAEISKLSSIQGLSGDVTSSIYYNTTFKRLVIGYETGLIEVVDENGVITISSDIVNFNQSGQKRINHISESGNILYLSTPFAIVEYNIENLEFGDTFFIGNGSTSLNINETLIKDDKIYAATEDGIFNADVTSNLLIDFNNWEQQFNGRNFSHIKNFNNKIYVAENSNLLELNNNALTLVRNFFEPIVNLNSSLLNLTVSLNKRIIVLDVSENQTTEFTTILDFDFTASNAFFDTNTIYIGTKEFGILKTNSSNSAEYQEIHPEGPLENGVFSIEVNNNDLWVVYGGYSAFYGSLFFRKGFSHFNGENWINSKYDPDFPVTDLNHISIDPNAENRVYISSMGDTRDINSVSTGGLMVVENDEITTFYNHLNSGLEDLESTLQDRVTVRITGTKFDRRGNLWVANINTGDELKKLSPSGQWSSFDISSLQTIFAFGLSEIAIDNNNTVWIGTRRNGVYAFNENGNRKRALIATPNLGNLPNTDVLSVVTDRSNIVWLGTRNGMVVFKNASTVFDAEILNAEPVIIEENGLGERLLGDQRINTIFVDGADNKWFGTDNGGALYTNPSGQTTLANFSKSNSPLPSNRILKIRVDEANGKVYFATDNGIVAYNSNVSPFGESLGEVYAYPNPALKNHETITIDGRNGTNLPKGTNVKILDVAGNLVYETNVVEGQQLQGGKVVWDKKNLAGRSVASGVYIVLLTNDDGSETATTKIAIVN